ncbi:unknown [Collinsella sp. CAG:398]|nr:unknown [Collinsella sp. CAG:398]
MKPRERIEVEHLGREALVLNADVGKRRRRNRAGNIRLIEQSFVENGCEVVQPLDVLVEELVVYAPELLEAVGTLFALDAKEFLAQALRRGGEGRDALRRERVLSNAHLLSGGDDGLEHGVLSERVAVGATGGEAGQGGQGGATARLSHAQRELRGSMRQFNPAQLSHMRQFNPARLSHALMGHRSRNDARPLAEPSRGTVPYLDRSPNRER